MSFLIIYLIIGVIVLIVGLSNSRGLGGGTPLADLGVALFVVILWPICIFAIGGRE
jgi:hypothetical protein